MRKKQMFGYRKLEIPTRFIRLKRKMLRIQISEKKLQK